MFLRARRTAMPIPKVRFIQLLSAIVFLAPSALLLANNNSTDVPVVDGGIGTCRADFTVKDEAGKPIYDAKIKVTLRSGFFNKRKHDLEIGTNGDGKPRVTRLPDSPNHPLEFQIKRGTTPTWME